MVRLYWKAESGEIKSKMFPEIDAKEILSQKNCKYFMEMAEMGRGQAPPLPSFDKDETKDETKHEAQSASANAETKRKRRRSNKNADIQE